MALQASGWISSFFLPSFKVTNLLFFIDFLIKIKILKISDHPSIIINQYRRTKYWSKIYCAQYFMHSVKQNKLIRKWAMIPSDAFLYFPDSEAICTGDGDKIWRKIFQSEGPYTPFEEKSLKELDLNLSRKGTTLHPWFDKANRLRFLQANIFKVNDCVKAIEQACKWRREGFPVKMTSELKKQLCSGRFYFCGRDLSYRPILVADISKFEEGDQQSVPTLLTAVLEHMLEQLLIEGQVENYVLLLDLENFKMNLNNTVMKILECTSNTYRGRLYASYLLGMPSMLSFVWNTLASSMLAENTMKKIKVSKKMRHEDMWQHIDPAVIEVKYGGQRTNMQHCAWPPSEKIMTMEQASHKRQKIFNVKLISPIEYLRKFEQGKLSNRKVDLSVLQAVQKQKSTKCSPEPSLIKLDNQLESIINQPKTHAKFKGGISPHIETGTSHKETNQSTPSNERSSKNIDRSAFLSQSIIKSEFLPPIRKRDFNYFEHQDFLQTFAIQKQNDKSH